MIKRLMQRRRLVISGCIFAAVVLGVACAGITPVRAATCEVAIEASGDQALTGSSEWTWTASDGDLALIPPLMPGQEVISGSYAGSVVVAGPVQYSGNRCINADSMLLFTTGQLADWQAPGIVSESLALFSVGAPASGITCGAGERDTDVDNLSRQAYSEYSGVSTLFMADSLNYRSAGSICQGDTEMPDSLSMDVSSEGHGYGSFRTVSRSVTGIGNTTLPGNICTTSEHFVASGLFTVNGKVRWSSFTGTP